MKSVLPSIGLLISRAKVLTPLQPLSLFSYFPLLFPPFLPVPTRGHPSPHQRTYSQIHWRVKPQVAETHVTRKINAPIPRLRTNGILQGKVIGIEDFFRGREDKTRKTTTTKNILQGEDPYFMEISTCGCNFV